MNIGVPLDKVIAPKDLPLFDHLTIINGFLERYDPDAYEHLRHRYLDIIDELSEVFDTNRNLIALRYFDEAIDEMQSLAPYAFYYGPNKVTGDYGFWKLEGVEYSPTPFVSKYKVSFDE